MARKQPSSSPRRIALPSTRSRGSLFEAGDPRNRSRSRYGACHQLFLFIITKVDVQVGVAGEKDTVHVPDLAFIPIRPVEQTGRCGHGRHFVRIRLDPDPRLVRNREQVVDYFEPIGASREIDSGNVHHGLVLALGVVPEEMQDRDDTGRRDIEGQFVLVHRELLDEFRQAGREVLPVLVHGRGNVARGIGGVDADRFVEWSCRGLLRDVLD